MSVTSVRHTEKTNHPQLRYPTMGLGSYSAEVYNELPDLPDAIAELENNPDALDELRDLILDFGLEDTVGVAALHKHFPIEDDEVIVEEMEDTSSTLRPETRPLRSAWSPYLWKLSTSDDEEDGRVWRPLEYVKGYTKAQQVQDRMDSGAFLQAAAEILENHGLEDAVGLVLHHREAIAEAGPTDHKVRLLEITGESERTMRVEPAKLDSLSIPRDRIPQTVWSFADSPRQRLHEQACYDHIS